MSQTVLIRPLPHSTPARASVFYLTDNEKKIDEGPTGQDSELKVYIRKTIKRELDLGNRHFLLDLSPVEWIDSTYVGIILSWHQQVEREDGEFVLVSLSDRSKEIMRVAKLDHVLNVFDTPAQAQKYFAKKSS